MYTFLYVKNQVISLYNLNKIGLYFFFQARNAEKAM